MTTFARLRRLNVAAAILHLGQAIAVVALANDFALPVTGSEKSLASAATAMA